MDSRVQLLPLIATQLLLALVLASSVATAETPVVDDRPGLEMNFIRPPMYYVTPPPPSREPLAFTITLNFTGGLTAEQQAQFTAAKDRWESRIVGYAPGITVSGITIDASGQAIDGPGGILGSAGPTNWTYQSGKYLTTTGQMRFDTGDIPTMMANGSFDDVIEHEMGHVIGIGIWWVDNAGYVTGSGQYTGPYGLAAWRLEFLGQSGASWVPVELEGGSGTANGHWNESYGGAANTGIVDGDGHDMRYELMTGWLNMPTFYSNTTHQSLRDLGFEVAGTATGACCLGNGGCSEGTASACSIAGGSYQGDGTTCAEVSCPIVNLLWDQTANPSGQGYSTQDFEAAYDTYDAEGADDFTVSSAGGWTISRVVVQGSYSEDGGPLTLANVAIYSESTPDTPGSAVCSHSSVAVTESPVGTLSIQLPSTCALGPGAYWLSVQGRMDYNLSGQYFWGTQTVQSGGAAVWRNPGGGFSSSCTSWGTVTGCNTEWTEPDFTFQVYGWVGGAPDWVFGDGFESGDLSAWTSHVP